MLTVYIFMTADLQLKLVQAELSLCKLRRDRVAMAPERHEPKYFTFETCGFFRRNISKYLCHHDFKLTACYSLPKSCENCYEPFKTQDG